VTLNFIDNRRCFNISFSFSMEVRFSELRTFARNISRTACLIIAQLCAITFLDESLICGSRRLCSDRDGTNSLSARDWNRGRFQCQCFWIIISFSRGSRGDLTPLMFQFNFHSSVSEQHHPPTFASHPNRVRDRSYSYKIVSRDCICIGARARISSAYRVTSRWRR